MAFYDFVVSEIHGVRPAELIELQKEGGKVFGTFCVFVPDEVVVACGGAVTGLCGGSQFWVPEGEKVLPSDMCPLVKASLGAHFGKTCPYFSVADMYVGDVYKRQVFSVPESPATCSPSYYARQHSSCS